MMTITLQELMALLPLLIVGATVMIVMLGIAFHRNHLLTAILSALGLGGALLSLGTVFQIGSISVTPLMHVDGASLFYTMLILLAGLSCSAFAYLWLKDYPDNKEEFYLLLLIAVMGGILLADASHLASLFLGIELLSLPLFGMIGYAFQRENALEASLKYTILSAAASSFLLLGIAFIYANSGDLTFQALGKALVQSPLYSPLLLTGLGLMIVGIGFKLSLVPFHLWTPDVYQGAPAPVSALLATVSKVAIFCVLLNFLLYLPIEGYASVRVVLEIIAIASILFGNLMALSQTSLKRMLGYSSIAHMGYLLVALVAVEKGALTAETVAIYFTGYIAANLGAFGAVSLLSSPYRAGGDVDTLEAYRGLFWRRPALAVILTLMMFSLAGIPLTLGFVGKFYVMMLALQMHLWWMAGAVVAGSAIGLFYYLRTLINLHLEPSGEAVCDTFDGWYYSPAGILILFSTLIVFVLGIFPQPLIHFVQKILFS